MSRVGFAKSKNERDKSYIEKDFAIVELKRRPKLSNESLRELAEYPEIDLLRHSSKCDKDMKVSGRGASVGLAGAGITLVEGDYGRYFVTVLTVGELGNSGTLMLPSVSCGALTKNTPFGVFSGR